MLLFRKVIRKVRNEGWKKDRETRTRLNGSTLISKFLSSNFNCWMLGDFIRLIVHKFFLYTAPKDHLLGSAAQAEFCAGPAETSILFKTEEKERDYNSFTVLLLTYCFRGCGNRQGEVWNIQCIKKPSCNKPTEIFEKVERETKSGALTGSSSLPFPPPMAQDNSVH